MIQLLIKPRDLNKFPLDVRDGFKATADGSRLGMVLTSFDALKGLVARLSNGQLVGTRVKAHGFIVGEISAG